LTLGDEEIICPGSEITVLEDGTVQLNLPPRTAIALLKD
jgi:hypothetical protein